MEDQELYPINVNETISATAKTKGIVSEIKQFRFFYGSKECTKKTHDELKKVLNEKNWGLLDFGTQIANITGVRFKDIFLEDAGWAFNIYFNFEGTREQYFKTRCVFQGFKMGYLKDHRNPHAIPRKSPINPKKDPQKALSYLQSFYWDEVTPHIPTEIESKVS